MLKDQRAAAKRFQKGSINEGGLILGGLHSAAPLLGKGIRDVSHGYDTYWRSGTCVVDKNAIHNYKAANPLFACRRGGLLHYGTNPTIGFHLSAIYAQLSEDSPLATQESASRSMPKGMNTLLGQLKAWHSALRIAATRIKIRYVGSDATVLLCVTFFSTSNRVMR
jgi:hypothetical protein